MNGIKTEENRIKDEKGLFTKGNPGGPGRPKGSFSLVEMIKNKLQEKIKDKDKTYAEYFIDQLMKKTVIDGDTAMMRDMINRVDGMPKQDSKVEIDTGDNDRESLKDIIKKITDEQKTNSEGNS